MEALLSGLIRGDFNIVIPEGRLRALSGIWLQTKPEYWAGTPDKRQGAFRGDIEVWASIDKVKQAGQQ